MIAIAAGLLVTSATVAHQRLVAIAAIPGDAPTTRVFAGVDPPITQTFSGITRRVDDMTIALPKAGVIQHMLVAVGDRVRAGQVLLTLENDQGRGEVERLRGDSDDARNETVQLQRTIEGLDRAIAAAAESHAHAAAELANAERLIESVPNRVKNSLESAQGAYDEAVARERRAAGLAAHGVFARQELEQAQIAVRAAADSLETARRAADAEATLATMHSLQARTLEDVALADAQRQREQRLAELIQAEGRQRAADIALRKAIARVGDLTVRAPRDGVVAEVLVRTGDQVRAGLPLVSLHP